jgi:hypothetical protein
MRRERREPRRQRARPDDQDPHHGGPQIVVRDPRRHAAEVGERPDMAVKKLI